MCFEYIESISFRFFLPSSVLCLIYRPWLRWNFGVIVLGGKSRSTRRETCPTATFLSANTTWTLLEMNAGLRVEKLAASRLSCDTTVLKFPVWFLGWLGLHWLGFGVISHFIFQVWTLSAGVHSISKTNSKPDNCYIETGGRRNTRRREGKKFVVFQVSPVYNFR